jgi:hypothetical protein
MFLSEDLYAILNKSIEGETASLSDQDWRDIFGALNIKSPPLHGQQISPSLRVIVQLEEQNRILTNILGEFYVMRDRGQELDAYRCLLSNLNRITSLFMLDNLLNALCKFRDQNTERPEQNTELPR